MDEYIAVFADMYGISEDDRGKAERCIESTIEYIKNYCHIDGIPDDLKHTVILMAADLFRYDISASSGPIRQCNVNQRGRCYGIVRQ